MKVLKTIYIELQEMCDNDKIKTGHFWFQGTEYVIENGIIKEKVK